MSRRTARDRDGLIVASLDGTALRMTDDKVDREAAIAEVQRIATVGKELRVDLLTRAAGGLLGRYLRDSTNQRLRHAALLLIHAGADPDGAKEHAQIVLERLRGAAAGGIGSPGRAQTKPPRLHE
jgi:hypothetical protein